MLGDGVSQGSRSEPVAYFQTVRARLLLTFATFSEPCTYVSWALVPRIFALEARRLDINLRRKSENMPHLHTNTKLIKVYWYILLNHKVTKSVLVIFSIFREL